MKKTPKHGTVVVAKQPIVVGTMVIPQNSVGTEKKVLQRLM